ncbi:virulence RhuM family protein [Pseudonocardia sp. MH-G8]|uniref:virulence RhuM family protein n=1 Tax=Pseudonocardia sp. MH-G8 TaxID=1854588 RepID=UPI000BA11256|nr:virulence RhuM family protein [Pseudonocardia sp. MH-G8]OZM75643.1 hydroxyacid dehydrogenase [Pseudonocardia sp. MH-G8]
MSEPGGELIVYRGADGRSEVQLRAVGGTVWLAQAEIAELYGTSVPNIVQIIRRILDDGEVTEATINSELRVRTEGSRSVQREVKVYNLDMVLAIGYRVSTPRAVQFRQWATTVLREYLVKGFVLDDRRLKDPDGTDYFDELLQRIRDIRASEKRFYQKVRDLFSVTSADYSSTSGTAKTFFATIQNKLIFAVTGHTAAELVLSRSDARSPSLGLTTWAGDRIRKGDVVIAKNYLTEPEITELNRLTTMFLDFAEDRAQRRRTTLMAEWVAQTDRFLDFNERNVLNGPGSVSASEMKEVAGERYAEFDKSRRSLEAEIAEAEELDDIRALTALDRPADRDDRAEGGG